MITWVLGIRINGTVLVSGNEDDLFTYWDELNIQ